MLKTDTYKKVIPHWYIFPVRYSRVTACVPGLSLVLDFGPALPSVNAQVNVSGRFYISLGSFFQDRNIINMKERINIPIKEETPKEP